MKNPKYFLPLFFLCLNFNVRAATFSALTDLSGHSATVSETKPYKLVVFWASWCPDCRAKMSGELKELDQQKDLSVITVNTDRDPSRAQKFLREEKITLPVYLDPQKELRKSLQVFSVPHWALYRRDVAHADWVLVESQSAFDANAIAQAIKTQTNKNADKNGA